MREEKRKTRGAEWRVRGITGTEATASGGQREAIRAGK